MKKIILCLVVLSIVGCGNKAALDEANAYRITQETIQAGLDAEQIRLAKTEAAKQKAIDDAYWNAVWASSMVAIKRVANFVAYSVGIALCVIAIGGGLTVKETVSGLGKAHVARAELEACLIHMDENTRTFPAFALREVDGIRFVTMLASGQTLKLDEKTAANPLLIAALAQVSTTGVCTRVRRLRRPFCAEKCNRLTRPSSPAQP